MGNFLSSNNSRTDRELENQYDSNNEPDQTPRNRTGLNSFKRKHLNAYPAAAAASANTSSFDHDDFNRSLNLILQASTTNNSNNYRTNNNNNTISKSTSSFYTRVSNTFSSNSIKRDFSTNNSASTSNSSLAEQELITPQKKKMRSTSQYIYNALFVNGEGSDVKVRALGKEWRLHKLYLCQSPYFDSMLKGCKWRECGQSDIELTIPDENIDERALFITFGSFYSEEVAIAPCEAVSVLACASLFSLDGLIGQCEQLMADSVSASTCCVFYEAALAYGTNNVATKCIKWLCNNITINQELRLAELTPSLMQIVLNSPELMIVRVETDLYSLCKRWLYYQLNRSNGGFIKQLDSAKSAQRVTNEYFRELLLSKSGSDTRFCLLEDEAFAAYVPAFRAIRLRNILGELDSLKLLYNDRIIPLSWIEPLYFRNWLSVLFVDQDHLAAGDYAVDRTDFEAECLRFGRILDNDSFYNWRWVGFNYGVDLILTHNNRSVHLKRNTVNTSSNAQSPYKGLLSNRLQLRVYYAVRVVELDALGNEAWSRRIDLTPLDLIKNEDKFLFQVDPGVKYPLVFNMYVTSHPFHFAYFNSNNNTTSNSSSLNSTLDESTNTPAAVAANNS